MRSTHHSLRICCIAACILLTGCCAAPPVPQDQPPKRLTDEQWLAIKYVRSMDELRALPQSTTAIGVDELDDEAAPILASLPNLRSLAFISSANEGITAVLSPSLTDEGVRVLARNKSIRHVMLSSVLITDAALETIGQMQLLTELHLYECHFLSREAIRRFQIRRPDVHVTTWFPPLPPEDDD